MRVGTRIVAPEGWGILAKGTHYYFLKSDPRKQRVLLVHFDEGNQEKGISPKAHLLVMPRKVFEEGALSAAILPTGWQPSLPPWLEELEGMDLSRLDEGRSKAKKSHEARVEERYGKIGKAIGKMEAILAAQDPQQEINRQAALCTPPQNESRFRTWLLTYLCFGRNIWSLLPPFHHIGRWNREKYPGIKFGRPSIAFGSNYGFGRNPMMVERCVKSYQARAKLGRTMVSIYREAMASEFKCRIVTSSVGLKSYVSADGLPFPTYCQYKYAIEKTFGKEAVQLQLYGAVRYRSRIAKSKGRFSEELANLMERVEADGYYTKERPKGYIEGSTLSALCVVRGVDGLSGLKVGIGFALGNERGAAYRMMLFSMAVPKDFFCMLFGVTLERGEWNSVGLPPHLDLDRGPGARRDLIKELQERIPIKGLAPSYSGQSKATVESSHPRQVKSEGKPRFVQSNLTPVEMVRREITRLLRDNQACYMEDRFDPDSELASVPPNAIGLWDHYDGLYRNDAQPMSIDEAVRTFLTPMEFQLHEDGVYLNGRRYTSADLEAMDLITDQTATRIQGYVLDMCVRHVWVEVRGRLYMLEAKLRIRGDDETLWMSLAELEQWDEARRKIKSEFSVHQHAASSEYMDRFEKDTGKPWNSGSSKPGKPKRDATARQEEAEALEHGKRRKRA